jgi:imidazolonepropionase-like amidohydrolase
MFKFVMGFSLLLLGACTSNVRPGESRPLAITNVTVIDVAAATAEAARLPGRTVVIENGTISSVSKGRLRLPPGTRKVDGTGRFLMPGLWDSHTHITMFGEPSLPLLVSLGVTTVRDMGGDPTLISSWRQRIEAGRLVGPRIFHAGPIIEGAWWLDPVTKLLGSDPELSKFPFLKVSPRLRLAAAGEAASLVGQVKAAGADVLKFRNLRPDEFKAVAAEAARAQLLVVGHAPRSMPPGEAAEAGMASIEHMETVTLMLGDKPDAERLNQFRRVAAAGTAITPGMGTAIAYRGTPDARVYAVVADKSNRIDPRRRYLPQLALDAWRWNTDIKKLEGPGRDDEKLIQRQMKDLRLAGEAGVPFLIGTDLTVPLIYPGYAVHEEMAFLVREGGISTLEVLRAATLNAANAMRDRQSGQVLPEFRADLLLLAGDPLADIGAISGIEAVVIKGRFLDKRELAALREEAAALARSN